MNFAVNKRFWRWAVVPLHRKDIVGIGFWTRHGAEKCRAQVMAEIPWATPPVLMRRTGWRRASEDGS